MPQLPSITAKASVSLTTSTNVDELRLHPPYMFECGTMPLCPSRLAAANLEGHDSHGVVRIPEYVGWMEAKLINIGARLEVVKETEALAVMDGNWGWGQVVGRQAMEIGIQKAARAGAVTISVRQCCHLGRVGDYPLMAAHAGLAAVMFVNTHGGGKLVAPGAGASAGSPPTPFPSPFRAVRPPPF